MGRLTGLTIIALLLATSAATTQPACLPKSVFVKNPDGEFPLMHLGYIKDLATLCGYERDSDGDKFLGCWTVNPTTGALGASAATAIPGRGRRTALDAQNCIDGYCIGPTSSDGKRSFFAASTSGSRTAILTSDLLYIFETSTKNKLTQIELAKHGAPDETNVGNMPWDILYNGDTVFVIGADAGPFIAAWVFKDNGDRAGQVRAGAGAVNIFRGGYGILGHDKIALADAGLQNMTTVIGANVGKQNTKRTASYAPCRRRQFSDWTEGQDTQTGACKTVLDAKYRPYVDTSPVQLPSRDIIVTLSGPAQGDIAVLNPTKLTEKHRFKLARCP